MSAEPRAGAVLYAKNLDGVARFYEGALQLRQVDRDKEHVRLESAAFQLVVLRMPERIAATIEITTPPIRREDTAVKLVFFVESIAAVRASAPGLGGTLNSAGKEWMFNGCRVCDGVDSEGNVFQLRESAAVEQWRS